MAHTATILLVLLLASSFCLLNPHFANAISGCNGPCNDVDDCSGQLICINGNCNDDPDVGTHTCSSGSSPNPPSGGGSCASKGNHSPPVTSSTPAKFMLNDFSRGGDGGGPSECDGKYHPNSERVVALSTGWYNNGSRCGKMIRITAGNGRTTTAKVVDECDSVHGCDNEHAGRGTCGTNVVNASVAVWNDLGLDTDVGVEHVTWSMA